MKNLILIPTYNERENIRDIISRIRVHVGGIDIMVIDDHSPDGTADVVKEMMKKDAALSILERHGKEGLGAAYMDALKRVRLMEEVENLITMDADGSHDPEYLSVMLGKMRSADLVIGSRYVKGGGVENWKWHRRMLSKCGNIYSRFVLGMKVRDLTAGFVCFRKTVLDDLDFSRFHSSGYAYQIEFKYYCLRAGHSWVEIPIIFKERRTGTSKISPTIVIGGLLIPVRLFMSSVFGSRKS